MVYWDFHEAYESKGIITLTEADKLEGAKAAVKGIVGKIVEILDKGSKQGVKIVLATKPSEASFGPVTEQEAPAVVQEVPVPVNP